MRAQNPDPRNPEHQTPVALGIDKLKLEETLKVIFNRLDVRLSRVVPGWRGRVVVMERRSEPRVRWGASRLRNVEVVRERRALNVRVQVVSRNSIGVEFVLRRSLEDRL